jgi:hypothetical protein
MSKLSALLTGWRRHGLLAAAALGVLLLAGGCSYSTRNALPPHMKSIAVPMFTNKTFINEYTRKVEVEVTEAVRNAFIQGGELKVVGREGASLILEGEITKLDREVLRNDRFGDPAEVRLTIRARISLYDVKEARHLFKDVLVTNAEKKSESGVYNLRRGEDEAMGRQQAIEDIGKVIMRRVVERW